jgi:two-component system cell cycle sensor histidine kinase/response regulator CckA
VQDSFRELAEKSLQGIMVYQDGRLAYANPAMAEIHGYSVDELMAKSTDELFTLVHPEDQVRIAERRRKRLAGEPVEPYVELRVIRNDGDVRWIHSNSDLITFDGRPAILSTSVDITERKQALHAAAMFRSLVDHASDSILVIDPISNRIVDANEQAYVSRGFTRAEFLALPICASELERGSAFEATHQHKNGTRFPVEVSTSCVTLDREYIVAVVRDVSEQKRAQQALRDSEARFREAQKMEALGRLAAGVAHDFNNLLAIIKLQLGVVDAAGRTEMDAMRQIAAATERATELTRQLLVVSRRNALEVRSVDLNDVVSKLAMMVERIIGKDVRVRLHTSSTPVVTRADAGMLDQLVLNLVVNARDAMPNGGELRIETGTQRFADDVAEPARAGTFAWLRVSDDGIGIASDVLQHIFEPFFTTKEPGKGTGLGLAAVFGIAEQHGGWVEVESEPGRGARFRVFLPAYEELVERTTPVLAPGSRSVLLVEDDAAVRVAISTLLDGSGYDVIEARDALHAVTLWDQRRGDIALVLTDVAMPGGTSGVELARRLRLDAPALRFVFMSGSIIDAAAQEQLGLREGENFARKPFSPEQLLDVIRRQLDTPPA